MSNRGGNSVGVALAALGLVLAVWGSLMLSGRQGEANERRQAGSVILPDRLDGFRADAWFLPDSELLGFVEIPAGSFTMGSNPGVDSLAFDVEWWGNGRVQGLVELPTYYLARTEVTVAQYAAFLRSSGHPLSDAQALEGPLDHPVTFVSWPDAVAYARWLDGALQDEMSGDSALARLLADGWRVSLPSEAEWEKAARGADARIYPWGSEPRRDRANYRGRGTTSVGSLPCPECPYPLSDMAGNVWEWTRSPYRAYPFVDSPQAIELEAEALWVMRGGSFGDPEQFVRAANRGGADPGARRPFIGFRVALVRK
jgi:formylglycine-generating enzyme required for sulfatase activity